MAILTHAFVLTSKGIVQGHGRQAQYLVVRPGAYGDILSWPNTSFKPHSTIVRVTPDINEHGTMWGMAVWVDSAIVTDEIFFYDDQAKRHRFQYPGFSAPAGQWAKISTSGPVVLDKDTTHVDLHLTARKECPCGINRLQCTYHGP